jgi:hypothetical protein
MFTQEMRWSPRAVWALWGLFAVVLAATLAPAFTRPMPDHERLAVLISGLATTSFCVAITWIFLTLRITVDERTLIVGFGPFRERVPLERVAACGPATYRWLEWGGFGIRLGWRGKLYNVPGDRGIAVQVNLTDGRRLLFSSPDPAAVCQAMRARRMEIAAL